MPISLELIDDDIRDGLKHDAERRSCASTVRDYYQLDVRQMIDDMPKRPDEFELDFRDRPKRLMGLVHSAIETLCAHLYNPGPNRSWPDASGQKWLEQVYRQNQINALMQAADVLATLYGAAAIGLTATGRKDKPIRLDAFGGDEFTVWCPPDDPLNPEAICVHGWDRATQENVLTLWTPAKRVEYRCKKEQKPEPAKTEENPYGALPFAFFHTKKPIRDFWEGGLGSYLAKLNQEVNRELSDIADQSRFAVPVGVATDVPYSQRVAIKPGFFNRLQGKSEDQIKMSNSPPALSYVQAQFDATGRINALLESVYASLESIGVPRSAVRMEQTAAASGIALVCEQLPQLTRAKRRQPLFDESESEQARMILLCSGTYYRKTELLASAQRGPLSTQWPDPVIPLPMPEKLDEERLLLESKETSRILLTMRRHNMTEPEATAYLKKCAEQEILVDSFSPKPEPEPEPVPPPQSQPPATEDDDQDPDPAGDDPTVDEDA